MYFKYLLSRHSNDPCSLIQAPMILVTNRKIIIAEIKIQEINKPLKI